MGQRNSGTGVVVNDDELLSVCDAEVGFPGRREEWCIVKCSSGIMGNEDIKITRVGAEEEVVDENLNIIKKCDIYYVI